jgi:hypothetical protein
MARAAWFRTTTAQMQLTQTVGIKIAGRKRRLFTTALAQAERLALGRRRLELGVILNADLFDQHQLRLDEIH